MSAQKNCKTAEFEALVEHFSTPKTLSTLKEKKTSLFVDFIAINLGGVCSNLSTRRYMIAITLLAYKIYFLRFVSNYSTRRDFYVPELQIAVCSAVQLAVIKYLFTHLTAPTGIAKSFNVLSQILNVNELSGKVGRSLLMVMLKTGWSKKQEMN